MLIEPLTTYFLAITFGLRLIYQINLTYFGISYIFQ